MRWKACIGKLKTVGKKNKKQLRVDWTQNTLMTNLSKFTSVPFYFVFKQVKVTHLQLVVFLFRILILINISMN